MSGNWAWRQVVCPFWNCCASIYIKIIQDIIVNDPSTHGSMFVPIILGSNKTTVSVGTGNNKYWPVYLSISNIHNKVHRAHRNGLVLFGFLAIPQSMCLNWLFPFNCWSCIIVLLVDKEYADNPKFWRFRRQLFHTSMSKMLECLHPRMTVPEIVCCGDGNYRHVIYGIGLYIVDYSE